MQLISCPVLSAEAISSGIFHSFCSDCVFRYPIIKLCFDFRSVGNYLYLCSFYFYLFFMYIYIYIYIYIYKQPLDICSSSIYDYTISTIILYYIIYYDIN